MDRLDELVHRTVHENDRKVRIGEEMEMKERHEDGNEEEKGKTNIIERNTLLKLQWISLFVRKRRIIVSLTA